MKWSYTAANSLADSSPAIGPDGTIYVGAYDDNLYAIGSSLPALTLAKSVSPATAAPGGTVTYTLACADYGCTATNVIVTDVLPANIAYVTGSAGTNGSYNAGNNTLTWSLGPLAAGGAGQVTFQATVTATGSCTISNAATTSCTQVTTPVSSNTAAFTVTPPLTAVSLATSPASPQPANTPITLGATATGGTGVQFQFWLYHPAATPAWTQLQAYSSSASCVWTPATAGPYLISLTAQDGVTGAQVNATAWYAITGAAAHQCLAR